MCEPSRAAPRPGPGLPPEPPGWTQSCGLAPPSGERCEDVSKISCTGLDRQAYTCPTWKSLLPLWAFPRI